MTKIESPCSVTECLMDDTVGHCVTCGRTRDDLANWISMGPKLRGIRARAAKQRMRKYRGNRGEP